MSVRFDQTLIIALWSRMERSCLLLLIFSEIRTNPQLIWKQTQLLWFLLGNSWCVATHGRLSCRHVARRIVGRLTKRTKSKHFSSCSTPTWRGWEHTEGLVRARRGPAAWSRAKQTLKLANSGEPSIWLWAVRIYFSWQVAGQRSDKERKSGTAAWVQTFESTHFVEFGWRTLHMET